MKMDCNIIKDLLPLYHDEVCSRESKKAVEDHMKDCESCRNYYQEINVSDIVENVTYDAEQEKKKSKTLKQIKRGLIITGILIAIPMILVFIWVIGAIYDLKYGYSETTDIYAFTGREGLLHGEEYTEIYSQLLGFPESTEAITVEEYLFRKETALFDTPCQIFLRYSMSEETFASEKERLLNTSISYGGEENKPIYLENICGGYAYVITYDRLGNYEYVILNEDKNEIVCVFLQREYFSESKIPEEYRLDETQSAGKLLNNYNMYE